MRALQIAAVSIVWASSLFAQQHPTADSKEQPRATQAPTHAQTGPRVYQRHGTWYEFLLKQFNPDNFDYGAWMEQHRQIVLNATVRNRYFDYSATVTVALLIVATLYAKKQIDHRRVLWVTAEMMADLYNHDAYSRTAAREAIQKYNEHIERCNRAIEAAEHGMSTPGTNSELDRLRNELRSVADERDLYKRERDLAKSDLAEKERILADLSLRLDALGRKSEGSRSAAGAVDARTVDQKLVNHINNLQEQLYEERRENRRLKGA